MKRNTIKYVNFKIKDNELLEILESLAFYYGKSQQEILEESLFTYWDKCKLIDKDLEVAKKLREVFLNKLS